MEHLFACDRHLHRSFHNEGPLPEPFDTLGFRKKLGRLNVRSLQALVALHDLERHALTLGQ